MTLVTSTFMDDMYNAIVAILETVADPNNTSSPVFQNADNSWNIFDGRQEAVNTPAAMIVPSDGVPSEYATSNEDYRGYGFYIFIVIDTIPANYAATRKNMRLIEDSVLDAFDRSGMLNGVADILQAASTRWIEEETGNGLNIVAPITLSAQKTIEIK
jgi:hypothetical protein